MIVVSLDANMTSDVPVVPTPAALELVKDAVVFIERAQLTPEVFMNLQRRNVGECCVTKGFNIKTASNFLCKNMHEEAHPNVFVLIF